MQTALRIFNLGIRISNHDALMNYTTTLNTILHEILYINVSCIMHFSNLQNISEGYVAVRSDPSLMTHLSGPRQLIPAAPTSSTSLQRVPPSLGGSHPSLSKTPATSAGYFSNTESDAAHDDLSVFPALPRSKSGTVINGIVPAYSTVCHPLPMYSRHSLTPPGKQKQLNEHFGNKNTSANLGDLKYVSIAFNPNDQDNRLNSPENFNLCFDNKHRPPSMPSLMNIRDDSSDPAHLLEANNAYSVVGNRNVNLQPVTSSHPYVTFGNQPRPQSNNIHLTNVENKPSSLISSTAYVLNSPRSPDKTSEPLNPYYTVGETNKMMSKHSSNSPSRIGNNSRNNASNGSNGYVTLGERGQPLTNLPVRNGTGNSIENNPPSSARSHYVTAAPNRTAFQRLEQLDVADEVRFVASAPSENSRGRVNPQDDDSLNPQLSERPNTSDGVPSRPKRQSPPIRWPGPSLSKQSSGYVSQEALGAEPLVMSPKRLFAQNNETKAMVANPHEVSFV